jgi:ribonuclease HI
VGVLLSTPEGEQFKYMVHLDFKKINNMAEYEALIFRLSTTLSLGAQQMLVVTPNVYNLQDYVNHMFKRP